MADEDDPEEWAREWLDTVASGKATMSQRLLSTLEARGGGVSVVKKLAQDRSVHLVLVVDENDQELVAASRHPFEIIC